MENIFVIILVVFMMIFLNGLYVAGEFSAVSSRRTRVRQMAAEGNKSAKKLLPILESSRMLDDYIAACQLGITVTTLTLGAFGERIVAPLFGRDPSTGEAIAIASTGVLVVFTLLQVITSEMFPKTIAVQYPEKLALLVVTPVRWSMMLFKPLIWLFNGVSRLLLRMMGRDAIDTHATIHSAEEIEILVSDSHEGGLLDDDERLMLRNAFRLRDLTARQVMLHRTRIVAAAIDSTPEAIMRLSIESGHSRIPIYEKNIEHVKGFVHVKDMFKLYNADQKSITPHLRELLQVPDSVAVMDIWNTMKSKRQYITILFDEYGSTTGMLTFEDLIEEIFGELLDEFDDEPELVFNDAEGRPHLRGDLLVTDVNEFFDLSLPDDSVDTLGGLVFSLLGRTPLVGEVVTINDLPIRVEKMEDRAVTEVSFPPAFAARLDDFSEWGGGQDE